MELFEVVTIKIRNNGEYADEYLECMTDDKGTASRIYDDAKLVYDNMTEHDKKRTVVECRVYNVPDGLTLKGIDEMYNAIEEYCTGYDTMEG